MTKAVATTETGTGSLRERIEQQASAFEQALPGHIKIEKFVRTVQTAVQMNPDIASAAKQSPAALQSLFSACTKAATDGLIIDGREAALVTFNVNVGTKQSPKWEKHIQYIPMVAGLMKKARNSGEIASIAAHVVYANDKFAYVLGDDERIEHEPTFADRGAPIAVYAIVRLKDGTMQREVMDKAAVMRIAGQSKNPKQYDPGEGKNFGEWWRKTVIRRISKYLPSSSDRDEFMQAVERIDEGFDFEPADDAPAAPKPATKARGGAAAKLKDVTPAKKPNASAQPPQQAQEDATDFDPSTGEVIEGDGRDTPPMEAYEGDQQQAGDDI